MSEPTTSFDFNAFIKESKETLLNPKVLFFNNEDLRGNG